MIKLNYGSILSPLALVLVVGCESKFVESTPDSIKIEGVSLDERINHKAKMDSRIGEIEEASERLQKIIRLFRKVQDSNSGYGAYTPLDFIIDVNSELKENLPEIKNGRTVRKGTIEVPLKGLSEDCKTISTELESEVVYQKSNVSLEDQKAIGEKLTYSFSNCHTQGKFVPVLRVTWIGSTMEFKFEKDNTKSILDDLIADGLFSDSKCKFEHYDDKILSSVVCEDLKANLSQTEWALIKTLKFKNSGDLRLYILADIFEGDSLFNKKKATSKVELFADGQVKIDAEKVPSSQ
ncbi:hypothetical protein GW916_05945 [bacterium]|nr:hypothetical protein [bacterium]